VSNLSGLIGESSNLCILGIIFLGSYFSLCEVLELVFISTTFPSSSKTVFRLKTYCVSGVEGLNGLSFIERLNLSSFGFAFCG
jgi:hypothetical protein